MSLLSVEFFSVLVNELSNTYSFTQESYIAAHLVHKMLKMSYLPSSASRARDCLINIRLCSQLISMQIIRRLMRVATSIQAVSIFLLTFLPRVAATNETGSLDYTARQPFNNEADEVKSDIESMVTLFHFKSWIHRGRQIRDQNDRAHCIGNLSLALSQVGPLTSYSSQGASGALSLLPTAGALIGAPAKELWVLYKLMPLAGILSMILSLGGNIVPMDATDYELSSTAFAYGGLIATQEKHIERRKNEIDFKTAYVSPAETFANRVEKRAQERRGSTKRFIVFVGICFQISWFCILMFACYFAQSGGVVAWWCKVSLKQIPFSFVLL